MRVKLVLTIGLASLLANASAQSVKLTGAGSTFASPLYSRWIGEYQKEHTNNQIVYQSIGSAGGVHDLIAGAVDFGATDGPLTDTQMAVARTRLGTDVLHFPTALGADVPIYNLPDISPDLNFTADALAGIFLGRITKWNDPALQNANPGIKLPSRDIVVVHRSDGSGTTYVWADYLAKVSPEWKTKVGVATVIVWPVGIGGKGNDGVADAVKRTPNSIGYVELIYAIQTHMPYGKVKNSSGSFIKANLVSVTAAADAAVKNIPADFRVSITDPPGKDAYPISSFTWLLIPKEMADKSKGAALKAFLIWGLTAGQNLNESLSYSRVPQSILEKELVAVKQLKY